MNVLKLDNFGCINFQWVDKNDKGILNFTFVPNMNTSDMRVIKLQNLNF